MTIDDREGLPEGWANIELDHLCQKITDGEHITPEKSKSGIPLLTAKNIRFSGIDYQNTDFVSQVDAEKFWLRCKPEMGDIVICSRGTIGRSALIISDQSFCLMGTVILLKPLKDLIKSKYLSNFIAASDTQEQLNKSSGATAIKALYLKDISKIIVPLPPLAEQVRIADKLDALLSRVDAGRERLERVPKLVKRFRQSVLSAAVSGELTREWRGDGDEEWDSPEGDYKGKNLFSIPPTWEWRMFEDVANIDSNLVDPNLHPSMPHIAPNHIESGSGKLLEYKTILEDGVTSGKHLFKKGHLLYSKIRPYLRKAVVIEFAGLCSADMYPISGTKANNHYLKYWLLSDYFNDFADMSQDRTVLPKINQNTLNSIPIPLPSIQEQAEIVRRVEILLAIADRLEARAQAALARYSRLTPALLAKAFRGELVPQDPADEPASVLLERIRAQRETAGLSKKAPGRGRKPGTTTPRAEDGAGAGEAQAEPKRGRGRPRKVVAEAIEAGAGAGRIPLASSQEDAIRLLQERARAEREGKQAVQAGLFGGE